MLVFYCINVTGALASVLSVRLRLVPFWTTQPSYCESHPTENSPLYLHPI